MNDQQQITPTLGPGKLILIGMIASAIVWFVVDSREPQHNDSEYQAGELLPAGCTYGLLAAGCWLATAIEHRYGRLFVRAGFVIGTVTLMAATREHRTWFQTAADLSGLAIVQCALFYWFQVPRWSTSWRADAEQPRPRSDQFSIADIAIATTVVALLLALVIRYSPAIRPVAYWSVLAAAWLGGAAITTCIAKAMTSKQILKAVALLSTGLVLAYVGTYTIAVADSIVDKGSVNANNVRMFASYYGQVVWGYLLTFVVFAALGRVSPS